jgi:hypothetical protein
MKLSDFENIGKDEYNKGFGDALTTVIKLLDNQICFDYKADGVCEHQVCHTHTELMEGLEGAKRNLS